MCAPSAPATPDPYAVSAAQTQSNTEAARLQAKLNRVNTTTPWGTLGFAQDPNDPDLWSANVTLSPDQQKLFDSNNQTALGMNQAGADLLSQVQNAYKNPLNFSGLPGHTTGVNLGDVTSKVATPELPGRIAEAGPIQANVPRGGPLQNSIQTFGITANQGNLPTSVSKGPLQTGISTEGMQTFGGQPAQKVMDFGANLPQTSFQANTASGPIQMGLNRTNLPDVTQDYSADRAKVEEALFSRLNPQLSRDRGLLESRLATQGITQGSEAYNRAVDEANRSATDARMQAILAGGQEQSRLADLALRTRGQLFGEDVTAGQFANTAQAQQYSQKLSDAQLENQRAALAFEQALSASRFRNDAQGQDFNQQLAQTQQANATRGQQVSEELAKMSAGNQVQAQDFSQGMANANLVREVDAQRFGQGLAASGQNFAQGLAAGQFGNEAQKLAFDQGLAAMAAGNQAQAQQFGQNQAKAQFMRDLAAQQYGMDMGNANLGNQAQAQLVQQQFQNAGLNNDARQRMIQELLMQRNEPLNALSALRSGTQVNMPNFPGTPQTAVAPTNTAGNVWNAYNGQLGAYNAQVGSQNALMGTAGNLAAAYIMASDRRLKANIQQVGQHKLGVGLYRYNYIWDSPDKQYVGVMADEVQRVMPEAVSDIGQGYLGVDYAMIGGV